MPDATSNWAIDPVALAAELIQRPSITPKDEGALDVVAARLERLGFTCHRLIFDEPNPNGSVEPIINLYARRGTGSPNICFAGHTDVVPTGPTDAWSFAPFAAAIRDGALCGRGAVDMKGAIASFIAAAERFLAGKGAEFGGSISLLITGDEEGVAVNGTKKVLAWLKERGEAIDACVVGEPTSAAQLGDMIKIGRRGSMTGRLVVEGVQGHVAYPHLVDNAAHRLVALLSALTAEAPDDGTEHFQASSLQVTTIDIGNPATNVVPGIARATFNIRFNDTWSSATLKQWAEAKFAAIGGKYTLNWEVSGESFLVPPGFVSECLTEAIGSVTGRTPELSTTGGTSDARFIHAYCAVAEFGLVNATMHKVDERVDIADITHLTAIYEAFLERMFARA
ncbi:MAG: succinyl-diaminopimelate desuccinylase [Alphaproteobacteria bacterium]|nr:succinyl-diaminopimelate desuccinylase [Alphaproteobacteria bacterium]